MINSLSSKVSFQLLNFHRSFPLVRVSWEAPSKRRERKSLPMTTNRWCVRKCEGKTRENVMMAMILRVQGAPSHMDQMFASRWRKFGSYLCMWLVPCRHLFRLNLIWLLSLLYFASFIFSRIRLLHRPTIHSRGFLCTRISHKRRPSAVNAGSIDESPRRQWWRVRIAMCRQWFPLINSRSTLHRRSDFAMEAGLRRQHNFFVSHSATASNRIDSIVLRKKKLRRALNANNCVIVEKNSPKQQEKNTSEVVFGLSRRHSRKSFSFAEWKIFAARSIKLCAAFCCSLPAALHDKTF